MHLFRLLPQGIAWLFLLLIVLVSREVWLPCQGSSLPRSELPEVESEFTHARALTLIPPFTLISLTTNAQLSLLPPPTHHTQIFPSLSPTQLYTAQPQTLTHMQICDACSLSCYHSIVCHLKRRLRSQERWGFHLAFSTCCPVNLLITQTPNPRIASAVTLPYC